MRRTRRSRRVVPVLVAVVLAAGSVAALAAPTAAPAPRPKIGTGHYGLFPDFGTAKGGTPVSIVGVRFVHVTDVLFGRKPAASFQVVSSNRISARSPAHARGYVQVRVVTRAGTSNGRIFTFGHLPTDVNLSLIRTGSTNGGTRVEIYAAHPEGVRAVRFGKVAVRHFGPGFPLRVVAPPHAPGTVHVRLVSSGGLSPTRPEDRFRYAPASSFRWTEHRGLDPSSYLIHVSCVSTHYCVLTTVDGSVLTFDGTTFSSPVNSHLGSAQAAMDCAAVAHCVGIDGSGREVRLTADGWSAPTAIIDRAFAGGSLSCPNTSVCYLVNGGADRHVFRRHDGTWAELSPKPDISPGIISCPTVSTCVLAAHDGRIQRYSHGVWHAPRQVAVGRPTALSCATISTCVLLTSDRAYVLADGRWQGGPSPLGNDGVHTLDCPTATFCAVQDGDGYLTWDGTQWSHPVRFPGYAEEGWSASDVSCATRSFCVGVGVPSEFDCPDPSLAGCNGVALVGRRAN